MSRNYILFFSTLSTGYRKQKKEVDKMVVNRVQFLETTRHYHQLPLHLYKGCGRLNHRVFLTTFQSLTAYLGTNVVV